MTTGISTEAIMFFDEGDIVKEMLYPEFEAILDNVVGVSDFQGQKIKAAFVRINGALKVTDIVLFYLDFDASGYVDKSWNIPLAHLAENAAKGPDLGAGPVRLACRSQCPVSWHQRSLWDPDAHAGNKAIKQIVKAAKRNKLGITVMDDQDTREFAAVSKKDLQKALAKKSSSAVADLGAVEEEIEERLSKKLQKEMEETIAALKEEHKLRVATMKSDTQEHMEKLQALYRSETAKTKEALNTTKQLFAEEKHKNLELKKTLDQHAVELNKVRRSFQQQLEEGQSISKDQLHELEQRFELEAKAQTEKATAELKEMLEMREVELFYRDEQVGRLNAEITELRQERQNLLDSSGDRVLQRLVDSGITFVAYQPGVDPLTIPVRDIASYLDAPMDYVAEKSSVDTERYKQWVAHIELPVCGHRDSSGAICGEPLAKVEKPGRFIAGESDRCSKHNRGADALRTMMNARGTQ